MGLEMMHGERRLPQRESKRRGEMKRAINAAGLDGKWYPHDQWYKVFAPLPLFASCNEGALEHFLADPEVVELAKLAWKVSRKYLHAGDIDAWAEDITEIAASHTGPERDQEDVGFKNNYRELGNYLVTLKGAKWSQASRNKMADLLEKVAAEMRR
jgi:hypothetical protein